MKIEIIQECPKSIMPPMGTMILEDLNNEMKLSK